MHVDETLDSQEASPRRLPAPPRPSLSALRQTQGFLRDPFALLAAARAECGDLFALRLYGLGTWVFVCSPELADRMFKMPEGELSGSDADYKFLGFLVGARSVICLEGQEHLARKTLMSPYLNGTGILRHTPLIRRVVESTMERWPIGRPFSFLPHAKEMFTKNLFRATTGLNEGETLERLTRLSDDFAHGLQSPLMQIKPLQVDLGRFSPWGRIVWRRDRFAAELRSLVERRRREPEGTGDSLLDGLLEARGSNGEPLPTRTIADELMLLYVAGVEATSRFLCWTILGVLSRPDVLERVRHELDTVLRGQPIESEHLPKLEYLDAVVQEGIRYQPVSAFNTVRCVRRECELGGFRLDKGMVVAQCQGELGKRRDLFEEPSGFHPENFLGRTPRGWRPFGGGIRLCLGKGFALLDMKVTLATIFQRTDLELCQKKVRSVPGGFLLVPEKGLMVRLRKWT